MHVLIGNLDVAAIYYVTMVGDILEKIEWNETDDVRIFFANIYPFLDVSILMIDSSRMQGERSVSVAGGRLGHGSDRFHIFYREQDQSIPRGRIHHLTATERQGASFSRSKFILSIKSKREERTDLCSLMKTIDAVQVVRSADTEFWYDEWTGIPHGDGKHCLYSRWTSRLTIVSTSRTALALG